MTNPFIPASQQQEPVYEGNPFVPVKQKEKPQTPKVGESRETKPFIVNPKDWNWRTDEFGPHGESLPEGAEKWTPYGQPFFGGGLMGKFKEYGWNLTKDIAKPDTEEWNTIKSNWQSLLERDKNLRNENSNPLVLTDEQREVNREMLALGAESVGAWWRGLESNKKSPISWLARGVTVGIQAIGDVFSQASKATKMSAGALTEFSEAAAETQAPLPRLDNNVFGKVLQYTPLGIGYNVLRVSLSPDNGNWENVSKRIETGWNAGRVFYSGAIDETIKQEYMRRYEAGEDPDLLGMELNNRNVDIWGHEVNANLVEMGGELIFDPLNFVGAFTKVGKLSKQIEKAQDIGGLYRNTEAVDALEVIMKSTDDIEGTKAWKTVVAAHTEAVDAVKNGKLLKQKWGRRELTVASRENTLLMQSSDFIGNAAGSLMREGFSKDDFLEAFKFGIKSVSKDATEIQEGIAALSKLPNAPRWLGDDAITTFSTVRNLLENESGIVNFDKLASLFSKQNNFAEFVDDAVSLVQASTKNQFAKINEMEDAVKAVREASKTGAQVSARTKELVQMYDEVPSYAKLLSRINDSKIGQVRQAINNTLGKFYFNYQGGVAVKNLMSNNVLIGIDEGLHAFSGFDEVVEGGKIVSKPKIWTDGAIQKNLESWFGSFQPAASAGFETMVKAESGKTATAFGKLMEFGEQKGAMRIVDTAVRDTMKKLLKLDKMGDVSKLKKAGMTENDLRYLERLFYAEKGNTENILKSYRAYKTGPKGAEMVDSWRTLDFLTERQVDMLDSMDLYDDIHQLTRTAETTEDIESAFARLSKTIDDYGKGAVNDVAGISPNNPGVEIFGELARAENSGLIEKGASSVYASIMESASNAEKTYLKTLQETITNLQRDARIPMKKREMIANELFKLSDTLSQSGGETKRIADEIIKSAWNHSDNIKAGLDTKEELAKFWNKAGLEGVPPPDLTKRTLQNEMWKQYKQRQNTVWNTHFDKAFAGSEELTKSLEEFMDANALKSQFSQARWAVEQAQVYRQAVFEKGALRIKTKDNILWMAKEYGIPSASEKGVPLDKMLLNLINKGNVKQFTNLTEVPPEEALKAFEAWRVSKGNPAVKLSSFAIPPAHSDGGMPSLARSWLENGRGAKHLLDNIKNNIVEQWGRKVSSPLTEGMEGALQEFVKGSSSRIDEAKYVAAKVAQEQRKFTLLNYGQKTYGDVALSWIMPYHFWYTQQYQNWIKRLAYSPEVVAGYSKYRDAMEKIHYDMPDFFKQNIDVSKGLSYLGIKTDNPIFINLEAAVNPLYGLTGTDFNDPYKRTDWFSNTLDDMGKLGPSVWSPLQIANAIRLSMQGEEDAAARWGGRLFPETKQLGEIYAALTGKTAEFDPAVLAFSKGIDPYERSRIGRALEGMIGEELPDGTVITFEMAIDAANKQEGELWELAHANAVKLRAGKGGAASLVSWIAGVGFKARTEEDLQIDQMFSDVARLQAINNGGGLTPEQYKQGWMDLTKKYPYMDVVMLSKKGGSQRDAAFAYNVLGRIAPGMSKDTLELAGLREEDIDKFYKSKGFTDKNIPYTESEKMRFMATVLDLSAMLSMPDDATRDEWNVVKLQYGDMQSSLKSSFGDDIYEKLNFYYDLLDTDKNAAKDFSENHPEIDAAQNARRFMLVNNPSLFKYYGSLETIDSYYNGRIRSQLTEEFGNDIYEVQANYYDDKLRNPRLKPPPLLKQYWNRRDELYKGFNQTVVSTASRLPSGGTNTVRSDFIPLNATQKELYAAMQEPQLNWQDFQKMSNSETLDYFVMDYWQNGTELPYEAEKALERIADQNGYKDADELLQLVGLSLWSGQ